MTTRGPINRVSMDTVYGHLVYFVGIHFGHSLSKKMTAKDGCEHCPSFDKRAVGRAIVCSGTVVLHVVKLVKIIY